MNWFEYLREKFKEHPSSVGETYWEHFLAAGKIGFYSAIATIVVVIHAIFPFWFQGTGSKLLNKTQELSSKRQELNNR